MASALCLGERRPHEWDLRGDEALTCRLCGHRVPFEGLNERMVEAVIKCNDDPGFAAALEEALWDAPETAERWWESLIDACRR